MWEEESSQGSVFLLSLATGNRRVLAETPSVFQQVDDDKVAGNAQLGVGTCRS